MQLQDLICSSKNWASKLSSATSFAREPVRGHDHSFNMAMFDGSVTGETHFMVTPAGHGTIGQWTNRPVDQQVNVSTWQRLDLSIVEGPAVVNCAELWSTLINFGQLGWAIVWVIG